MISKSDNKEWTEVITAKSPLWNLKLREVYNYRDLLYMLVRRDFVVVFKQTILGPFWFVFPVLATSITYLIIFNRVANLPTGGMPPLLFYLAGLTCWNFFSGCFTDCANVFQSNASLFGKVYFPRLIVPISKIASNLLKLSVQMLLFLSIYLYYILKGSPILFNFSLFLLPLFFIILGILGVSLGIIVSSVTTKYRDMGFLSGIFVKLLMYLTPVIYPLSMVHGRVEKLMLTNPLTSCIEGVKYAFFGRGYFSWGAIAYSFIFMIFFFIIALIIFNKLEKNFIDTV